MAQFIVNKAPNIITIYDRHGVYTVDDNPYEIGALYQNECALRINDEILNPNYIYKWEVTFRNSAGAYPTIGYTDAVSHPGANPWSLWKDSYAHFNGSIFGKPAYGFNVTKSTYVYDRFGKYVTTLIPGDIVWCETWAGCQSGSTHKDWMRIFAYTKTGTGEKVALPEYHGYVDTKIDSNSMEPAVRGNW